MHLVLYIRTRKALTINWIGLHSTLEGRRIQDMLITINSCFQEKAPSSIANLLKVKDTKYNLRGMNMLSLPKVRSTKHGLRSFRYFAAKTWNAQPAGFDSRHGRHKGILKKYSSRSFLKLLLL